MLQLNISQPNPQPNQPQPSLFRDPSLTPAGLPVSRWERISRFFTLRPFGDELLTPSADFWLLAARVLVLGMALAEGVAWGWFGTGVATGWAGVGAGLTLGAVAFLVVWALDASLIAGDLTKTSPQRKWGLAFVRLGLTVFSVWLTAPYLTQFVFRADIEADLRRDQNAAVDQVRQSIAARADAKLADLDRALRADREALILEVSGRGRSGRYGDGLTSGAIRERIASAEAQRAALETARQDELAALNRAVEQGQFELVKARWGVAMPSDSPTERYARMRKVLERPEARAVQRTIEGGFWLLCVALALFKLLLQNKALEYYLSEVWQGRWRQYRKGAYDAWLHPWDRSTSACLMSPETFVRWHETALPRLRMAAQADEEARLAAEAEAQAVAELTAARAELEAYRRAEAERLTTLYLNQRQREYLQTEVAELEQLFAEKLQADERCSVEQLKVLNKMQKALDQKRAELVAHEQQACGLHFREHELAETYNRLTARIERLEAEAARLQTERERLSDVARRLRCELAAASFEEESEQASRLKSLLQPTPSISTLQ
ncbi:MAG: DUF4407 domain-containing protein [Chloracidobacterium sp.]|nr:DUF4407 domain-containing protein [Chloracidobacterium sp.]MDW8216687.1 DUF4407 domain-containing protein [Acidobacteriota bacterium]